MSTRGMAALVAGLGNGYFKATERRRREDIEDEERAYTMQERAFTKAERDRALKQREDLGAAAAPIAAEAVPQLDLGDPEAPPPTTRYRVAGKMLDTAAEADAAVKTANGAPAVAMRQAAVLQQSGDPVKAQALRTGSMQEQAGQLALSAAERADLKARFTAQLEPLTDFDQVGEFMSKSGGDGQGGNLKVQFVPSPDSKTVVLNTINPDGTLKPTARTFENSNKGLTLAKAQLGGLPPEKMLEHFHREAVEARAAAAQQEAARHNQAMEGLTGDKTAAQIEIATMRAQMAAQARAAKAGTGQPAAPQVTLKDLKDFDDDVNKRVTEIFQPKEGMNPDERTALGAKRNAVVSQANGVFHANATRGMPITAGTALQAIELAGDIKNITRRNGSDGQVYDTVLVNGMPIIVSAPLAKAAPTPAVPAPQPTPRAPLPTTASAPERQPAPAGSPQAAWEAKQARARTDMASAAAAKASSEAALSAQFQADKAALSPIDLARKYDKTRGKLSAKDAAELQAVERSIR